MRPHSLALPLFLIFLAGISSALAANYKKRAVTTIGIDTLNRIEAAIQAQKAAGHGKYNPGHVFVVDPAKQRMHVLSRRTGDIVTTVLCGTGKNGLGFGHGQTPTGFFTMGGIRIAENADITIQTGDTKKGVTGIYAEMLYPPSFPDEKLRGRVPDGVVIHSYNPAVSAMLRERRAKRLIGRVPCTTGCPVPEINEAKTLVPYLMKSAGKFDPDTRPNAALRALIARKKVKEYSSNKLGAGIFIMGGR